MAAAQSHKPAIVRENGNKGGRPPGSKDNLPGREKLRLAASEMGDELIRLALHGKTENIRCAAIRDGLARHGNVQFESELLS